jgi:thiol-disulfide isomerase/thioredoxin
MAPEFEAAAKELEGKVRFAKLDTDTEETMAARLNIMGLPTLLLLDKYESNANDGSSGDDDKNPQANAVLKGRLEGALRKDMIVKLCNYYFFDGPIPDGMA